MQTKMWPWNGASALFSLMQRQSYQSTAGKCSLGIALRYCERSPLPKIIKLRCGEVSAAIERAAIAVPTSDDSSERARPHNSLNSRLQAELNPTLAQSAFSLTVLTISSKNSVNFACTRTPAPISRRSRSPGAGRQGLACPPRPRSRGRTGAGRWSSRRRWRVAGACEAAAHVDGTEDRGGDEGLGLMILTKLEQLEGLKHGVRNIHKLN